MLIEVLKCEKQLLARWQEPVILGFGVIRIDSWHDLIIPKPWAARLVTVWKLCDAIELNFVSWIVRIVNTTGCNFEISPACRSFVGVVIKNKAAAGATVPDFASATVLTNS